MLYPSILHYFITIILYLHGRPCFLDFVIRFLLSASGSFHPPCRSSWDGGPYDVHHSISDDSHCGPQRLEASVLGLRLVICVSGRSLETRIQACVTVNKIIMMIWFSL